MNQPGQPPAVRSATVANNGRGARDVRALQRRVKAVTAGGTLANAPTSYHR